MNHRKIGAISLILLAVMALAGCPSTGDKESLNTAEQGLAIYQDDVNGGMTPEAAEKLVVSLTDDYASIVTELAGDSPTVEEQDAARQRIYEFGAKLRMLLTKKPFYEAGIDFFRAAIRYEKSRLDMKQPKED